MGAIFTGYFLYLTKLSLLYLVNRLQISFTLLVRSSVTTYNAARLTGYNKNKL